MLTVTLPATNVATPATGPELTWLPRFTVLVPLSVYIASRVLLISDVDDPDTILMGLPVVAATVTRLDSMTTTALNAGAARMHHNASAPRSLRGVNAVVDTPGSAVDSHSFPCALCRGSIGRYLIAAHFNVTHRWVRR